MGSQKSVLIATASALAVWGLAMPAMAQDAAQDDEEIVVTGFRASVAESIDVKRESDAVVDAITAEDVGKFPDRNVAEALQRVPGVQINREFGEGERVSVRGLAPNLTRTLLNGHALATADWFILEQLAATRSFNYLMLPADIIGQVQVFKSPTADLDEGGVGGTVNVITRNPLDLESLTFTGSAQGAYTEMSDSTDPQVSGLLSWSNQAGTLGILVAGVYQERNIRRDGVEVLGYFGYDHDANAGTADVLVPSLIGSALFQQERVRAGGNFAIQYRPNSAWDINLTGLYSHFDADNYNQNYLAWGSNALGGGGALTNATIVDGTVVAGTITSSGGGTTGRAAVFDAIDRSAFAETRNINLDTVYQPNDLWRLHFQIGYTDAQGDTEAQPFVEFGAPGAFDYDLRNGAPEVDFSLDPTDPDDMIFDFASMHQITNDDSEFYTYVDITRDVDLGALTAIQGGLKYSDHERETTFMATTFGGFFLPFAAAGCGGPCTPGSFFGGLTPSDFLDDIASPGTLTSYWQVDRGLLRDYLLNWPGVEAGRIPNPPENFSIEEIAYGGYVLGRFEGDDWRGNIGVRVITTDQTSSGAVSGAAGPGVISNAFGNFLPVTFQRSYTDVLPSANFAFDLTDDFVLRMAAARTMGRPDFTDIVPRVSLNPGSLTGTGGNPDLDPYRANQFDLSFEYYPTRDSVFALGLFYKDIQSFITSDIVQGTFGVETLTPNLTRCTPSGGPNPNLYDCVFDIDQRANGSGGRVQGFEVNIQTPLWGDFGLLTNYTYSDGETDEGDPLPGNSEHTFNLTGFYETDRLSARLSYTYRSEFFVAFDRASPLNQTELSSLDTSISLNVTPNVALTLDAINLTDEVIEQYSGSGVRPRGIYDNGRQLYLGARVRY
ncbi:MAG TPA: TonB-dependent receptor [Vitreimonas sp.]|uniref:TonB-dependent receptor n=1 Tax=Vitreimonas sp. TaxID=3069702 RepID=UPI002D515342|nr:TonB-dependent receptor [Vitreimonas sp.]HYD86750.1 TonB-dependent receptor [Vitreimonas sp.]